MPLTYAGVELLLPVEDGNQQTQSWLDAWGRAVETSAQDLYPWYGLNKQLWPVVPGRLVWPTGASRWASAAFWAGKAEVDRILARTAGKRADDLVLEEWLPLPVETTTRPSKETLAPNTSAPLVVAAKLDVGHAGERVRAKMYMLPPRPISQFAGEEPFYLIHLVDDRFFWPGRRFVSRDEITNTVWTAGDLVGFISDRLGVGIAIDPYASDKIISPKLLDGGFKHLPRLLDAVAQSIGLRVVVNLDGSVVLLGTPNAVAREERNRSVGVAYAGGEYHWLSKVDHDRPPHAWEVRDWLPTEVMVCFPRFEDNQVKGEPAYTKTINITEYDPKLSGNGKTHDLRTLERAIYWTDGIDPSDPTATPVGDLTEPWNKNLLDILAKIYAVEWWKWQVGGLNLSRSGIAPFVPDGRNRLEWHYRRDTVESRALRETYDVDFDWAPPCCHVKPCGRSVTVPRSRSWLPIRHIDKVKIPEFSFGGMIQTIQKESDSFNPYPLAKTTSWAQAFPSGDATLYGVRGGVEAGRHVELTNMSDTATLTVKHKGANLAADNIETPSMADIVLKPKESVLLKYDKKPDTTNKTTGKVTVGLGYWLVLMTCCRQKVKNLDLSGSAQDNLDASPGQFIIATTTAATTISGLAGGTVGDIIEILNALASVADLTIAHLAGLSFASNRFSTMSGTDTVIKPGHALIFKHDGTYWHQITCCKQQTTYINAGSTAPASPTDGDIWTDSCHIRYRCGGATYTVARSDEVSDFTLSSGSGTTTDAYATLLYYTNSNGVKAEGTIKNTHAANTLIVRATVTDAWTTTETLTTVSIPALSSLELETSSKTGAGGALVTATALKPWTTLLIEVISAAAGFPATYEYKMTHN